MTSHISIPFAIQDTDKVKKLIRILKGAKANLAISKMNMDHLLQILKNENKALRSLNY